MTPPVASLTQLITTAVGESTYEVNAELLGELDEMGFLITNLASTDFSGVSNEQGWLVTNFEQTMAQLKSRLRRVTVSLPHIGETRKGLRNGRQDVGGMQSDQKWIEAGAYRQRGTLLCAGDWQSPIYAASIPFYSNRISEGIKEHYWDYKRDGHLDAVSYERMFIEQHCSHLGSSQLTAYLTNSGMAAFSTVMHWLSDEQNIRGNIVAVQPMYFENLHIGRAFAPDMVKISPDTSEQLVAGLRMHNPSIVLCDVVSNCGEVREHDLNAILTWARNEATQSVAIVIDTTCMPMTLLSENLLAGLPENISVVFVESLAKHHQYGMDCVTGGIIVAHLNNELQTSLSKTRARFGTNIVDTSVGSLPCPDREMFVARMQRHSRNIRRFSEQTIKEMALTDGVLESLSVLQGTEMQPWYNGSCVTLKLGREFRALSYYQEFEQTVLTLARLRNLPLALGTSFGFDVTRLYLTAPSTSFEEPFLRLAVGTETSAEIDMLVEIVAQTNRKLALEWSVKPAVKPALASGVAPERSALPAQTPAITHSRNSVFLGEDALKDYLTPSNYQSTPLVELPADLNPFREDGVRIMAKMVPLVPLMNIKSIPAYSMLAEAHQRGELDDVANIIESSSSNTVLSLSVIARLFGIEKTHAIVDDSIAPSLSRMLRLFGIEVSLYPGPGHELFGKVPKRSEQATNIGSQAGWFNPGQYSNPDNPQGFARWLAPDLVSQTAGKLDIFAGALGTCGTIYGVSTALRRYLKSLEVVACAPAAGEAVPGPRELSLLADVTFAWKDAVDAIIEVGSKESFESSIKLLRRGILGGPSSGMNYAGLLKHLQSKKESGALKQLVQANGELRCAFLCCDSPLPHVEEYYDALGDGFFPEIHPVSPVNESNNH